MTLITTLNDLIDCLTDKVEIYHLKFGGKFIFDPVRVYNTTLIELLKMINNQELYKN